MYLAGLSRSSAQWYTKEGLFNTQKMSIEDYATMKYFYNAGKKSIINSVAGPSAKSVFSMQTLTIKNTGHCFWIRTSVLFKHILIVPIGKETLRINGIVHVINKSKY